ncbi:MAG: DUF2240 family protein [Methanomicrobiales archaeon]|nr:DUF2240 family protein [Methanomicrobiales archaeon]MDI6876145.1 DUF2240 family protein [Methanomicrobiales archaeon]
MSLIATVAAPFKHTRKDRLQKAEFIFYIAIEKKWMNRDQADRLIERAKAAGLIDYSGGVLRPLFDPSEVVIPLGFKPTSAVLEEDEPVQELILRIASAAGRSPTDVAAEMNRVVETDFDGKLRAESAVVLLAKKYGVPFADILERLTEAVVKEKSG